MNHYPTPTIDLLERASKSSDDSSETSDFCKKHPNSDQCEKPVSNNNLTIALSIVLPCLAIFCVLGYFLYRNYRRDKKESLQHDPDFDENGEATALPDYPNMMKGLNDENPFHNRNSVRYPMDELNRNSGFHSNYKRRTQDPYLDSFVLPYQHQTDSKLSLDDYAKNLGDSQGYKTPTNALSRTRANSMTLDGNLKPTHSNLSQSTLSHGHSRKSSNISPSKKVNGLQYTQMPNDSNPESVPHVSTIQNGSSSQTDSSEEDSGIVSPQSEKFGIEYENESSMAINNTIPQIIVDEGGEESSSSPFEDNIRHETEDESKKPAEESTRYSFDHSQTVDGDFTFNSNQNNDESLNKLEETTQNSSFSSSKQPISKSPRISRFNLLKNDSDDENDEEYDEEMQELTPQQQEEIKRMKSVYKVYFDRENTIKKNQDVNEETIEPEEAHSAIPDKINDHLKMDTNYDKRFSNTSSVYLDSDEQQQYQQYQQYQQQQNYYSQFNQQYQQQFGSPVDPQFYQQFQQQQFNYYNKQRSNEPLPALQKLRNPSDLRKSTLQTYTDFKPSLKNQTFTSSPQGKQPFVPIESDGVWTSPINSPSMQSQSSFQNVQSPQLQNQKQQQQADYFPQVQQTASSTSIPSATQLSRSSVVMLNPVTEITKSRKFKPAGSLPSSKNQNMPYYAQQQQQFGHSELNGPENDLIPGNRKSDVRRMMNSNF